MLIDMPFQDVNQRTRLAGGRNRSQGRPWRHLGNRCPGLAPLLKGAEKIANGIRFDDELDRQLSAERTFKAQDQLRSPEAVDAKIFLEPAGQGYLASSAVSGVKFACQLRYDRKQTALTGSRIGRRFLQLIAEAIHSQKSSGWRAGPC
jgi:hypothetical protein